MPRPVNARPDRTPENLKWTREALECGKTIKGWYAGKVYGCEGHFAPAFKPCHAAISGGKRTCPWCAIPQYATVRFQGYLPMYNERLTKLVICINLDNTVRCDAFPHLQPIIVGKGKSKTSPIVVNANQWSLIPPSGPTVRKVGADITPWLFCVLWKQECLQEYGDVSEPELPAVVPQSTGMVPPPELAIEAARKRGKLPSLKDNFLRVRSTTADTITPEPSSNGNGKHQPKPS